MEIINNDPATTYHYQFIFQIFSHFKMNKYLNKEFYINNTKNNKNSNNNVNNTVDIDLNLDKAVNLSRYDLEEINEFIQRKNFPERNTFKCFML